MIINITHITSLDGGEIIQIDTEVKNGVNSETRSFHILASQYMKMRPVKGEISSFEFDNFETASEVCRAYLRALNILSFGTNTAHTLALKLRRRGFSQQITEETVKMLRDKGFISEEADMKRDIEHCIKKRWGSRRILAHLHQKGYDDETLADAENELSSFNFNELCFDLLSSRVDMLPDDPHEKQKVIAFLSRYGYSMSEIKYALRRLTEKEHKVFL